MNKIAARWQNGQIVMSEPVPWPDGSDVEVRLCSDAELNSQSDDEPAETPEEILRWIAEVNAIPFPEMSDEEWASWQRRQAEDKERELSAIHTRVDRLIESSK